MIYIILNLNEIIIDIFQTPRKLIYLIAIFGALGFISLLNPSPLIIALPILAVSLLSTYEGYYGLGHHYTAGIIIPLIVAFHGGVPRAKIIWSKLKFPIRFFTPVVIVILLVSHIILSPSPISRLFWSEKIWSYNFKAYIPNERAQLIKNAVYENIPDNPDIVLSVQNTLNLNSLMKRRNIMLFPDGIKDKKLSPYFPQGFQLIDVNWKKINADYVLVDMKRPWFINDQGCEWFYGECSDRVMKKNYKEWIEVTRTEMEVIFEQDGFIIFKQLPGKS